jgi:hypothetical protein
MKPQVELGEKLSMTYVHADIPGHAALETAITNIARMTVHRDDFRYSAARIKSWLRQQGGGRTDQPCNHT